MKAEKIRFLDSVYDINVDKQAQTAQVTLVRTDVYTGKVHCENTATVTPPGILDRFLNGCTFESRMRTTVARMKRQCDKLNAGGA